MNVDGFVIAARNRLPGNDLARWVVEIRGLGIDLAYEVLQAHGVKPTGDLSNAQDLEEAGLAPDLANALAPDLYVERGFADLWRRMETIRDAALRLPPETFASLPDMGMFGPNHGDQLGTLGEILFADHFTTLEQASARFPGLAEELNKAMVHLCLSNALEDAIRGLRKDGWTEMEDTGLAERLLLKAAGGVLVICTQASGRRSLQDTLDIVGELGQPTLEVVAARGGHPVTVAYLETQQGHVCWNVDGRPQRPENQLWKCFREPSEKVVGMLKSLVGQLHAAVEGVPIPGWIQCPNCGSPRVDAARLETEWGRSSFVTDLGEGEFASSRHRYLRLRSRQNDRSAVVLRILLCPDCQTMRAFPGERPIPASSLPKRMAWQDPPAGVLELLARQTSTREPLPRVSIPPGIDSWLAEREGGATAQFSDIRLVYRTAFRLPDSLIDMSRSLRGNGHADTAWRDAVGRVGRGQPTVLSWELKDSDPSTRANQIVVLGIDPQHARDTAENWFGPVDSWEPVTRKTCWRGSLVGTRGAVELVVIQDFLGALGPFTGDGSDFEILDGVLSHASVVVYAGDGNIEWDEEGVEWAADEGKLVAILAPKRQLNLVDADRDLARIDSTDDNAVEQLFKIVDRTVDPETLIAIKRLRKVMAMVEEDIPRAEMDAHFYSSDLRKRAVLAYLSDSPEAWLGLLDGVLVALETEGGVIEHNSGLRPSMSAKKLQELMLPQPSVDGFWNVLEFNERTGFGASITRWLQPILFEAPSRIHLARVRAVCERMDDVAARYQELHELGEEAARGRAIVVRKPVLDFWWGVGAPAFWPSTPLNIPGLIALAPSSIRGKPTIFVGGAMHFAGVRFAQLVTGANAPIVNEVPLPSLGVPVIVLEPKDANLLRLEQRAKAGNLTVVVTQHLASVWEGSLSEDLMGIVDLVDTLASHPPSEADLSEYLPALDARDRSELASIMHSVRYEAGDTIVEAGRGTGSLAWIRSGFVAIDGDMPLGPGGLLGAETIRHRSNSTHEVIATRTVELVVLSHAGLDAARDAGHPAVGHIEYAAARQLALSIAQVGAPTGETSPAVSPEQLVADWQLLWPLVQRHGFVRIEAEDVENIWPEARAGAFKSGEVVAVPGSACPDMFILDGKLLVEDRRGQHKVGGGRFIGGMGLAEASSMRCTALETTKVLVLSEGDVRRVWSEPYAEFRQALIRSLRERWE